jgi:hypothetical protein
MKNKRIITVLVLFIIAAAVIATSAGIFSTEGPGPAPHTSVRGDTVILYGKGIYQHMSQDVAIQGVAQDYVTLVTAIFVLPATLYLARKNSLAGLFLLSGTLGYFLLTYLFYLAMAMYNAMFLAYVLLLGLSFFAFILTIPSYPPAMIGKIFADSAVIRKAGGFLIMNCLLIALLWLGVVLPPLFSGAIIPVAIEHYTTLIVQGFDLSLFLPMGVVAGGLAFRRNAYGYLFTVIYMIFLTQLMAALTSKIIFMACAGASVIPVIFIMPTLCLIAGFFSYRLLKEGARCPSLLQEKQ